MNEITEINEDNCVLEDEELLIINECLDKLRFEFMNDETKIFQKITKLNEMAKEKSK